MYKVLPFFCLLIGKGINYIYYYHRYLILNDILLNIIRDRDGAKIGVYVFKMIDSIVEL